MTTLMGPEWSELKMCTRKKKTPRNLEFKAGSNTYRKQSLAAKNLVFEKKKKNCGAIGYRSHEAWDHIRRGHNHGVPLVLGV